MKKFATLGLALCLSSLNIFAQTSNDKTWSQIDESNVKPIGKRQIVPKKYLVYTLNLNDLKSLLSQAPLDKNVQINNSNCIISLPLPNGTVQKFKVVEAPVMAPELAAQFPDIKTYSIKGIDDVYANGKIDFNEFGFHGMVRTINGDFFIDPYCLQNTKDYITYYTADFVKDPSQVIPEAGLEKPNETKETPKKKESGEEKVSSLNPPATCVGTNLRTYRLAVACTGEYAVAATGSATPTMAQTLAKIVTSVNRVDGVYETEVAIRLVLVPTQTAVIFTAAATDPFTGNNNAGTLINESQTVITATIGSANYDIGHTFSTGGGGLASLGCVCSNSNKARGITGSGNPVGDPFDIDYVAHEVGHQFGGNHTFNAVSGSCNGNRNGSTAVEPGSGITIMAYAGICGSTNDIAPNSIAYFHAISYDEIVNFSNLANGNNCATTTTTGNNPPVVTGSGNFAIPISTPFVLTGSATDPNNDPLTYSWEETSVGTAGANWNAGTRPFFRSYNPTAVPSRTFPINANANSGAFQTTKGEFLPSTAQTLQFRLTARDNKMGGGGVCYAINSVSVIGSAGPFSLTVPSTAGIVYGSGTQQTILWNVNNTDIAPISCTDVKISISTNGGASYTTLVNSTPNDGSELVTLPTVTANINTCRIKVESIGNVFYDVSNNNFTLSISVGVQAQSKNNPIGLIAYPNPATNNLFVVASSLNGSNSSFIQITDVLGKVVYKNELKNKVEIKEEINIGNFNSGVYFVTVVNGDKHSVYRFVKE